MALLTTMKGLPLAYSKDMQEDKEQVFDAADTLEIVLAAMTGMVEDLEPVPERMAALAGAGFSTATDLADWLVRSLGLPFRDAHHITGRIVAEAERRGCGLENLPLSALRAIEPRITTDEVYHVLGVENSVRSRTSFGGTAPTRVAEQVAWWRTQV
jgi:argininosuccinate lyase